MDYSRQHPHYAPPPPSTDPYYQHHHHHYNAPLPHPDIPPPYPYSTSIGYQNPNPVTPPRLDADAAVLKPPGVDSYVHNSYAAGYDGYAAAAAGSASYSYTATASSYYTGSGGLADGAASAQAFFVKEAIQQYGMDPRPTAAPATALVRHPEGFVGLPATHGNSGQTSNWQAAHHPFPAVKRFKKGIKGPVKAVQSAYCQVCKIDCNSAEVLNNHKLGKKHKKNLEKLKESIAPKPVNTSGTTAEPTKGTKSNNQKKKKAALAAKADIESKKRRVLEQGAAQDAVKVCAVCNVVCNSDVVYSYHLAGKKHADMVKKQGTSGS